MESVRPSQQPTHYLVEEEYTVGVPLVRPKPLFLEILRGAGATGEIFTKKEICNFLKIYIGSRRLYVAEDPRVVHCSRDLLGAVFDVESFTIGDVLKLIEENITHVPDTCLKTKTHFVKKPLPVCATSSQNISSKFGGVSQTVSRKPSSSSALETDDVSSSESSVCCTSETVILSDNSLSNLALDKKSKKKKKKKKKEQRARKRKSEDQPGPSSKRSRSVSITYGDGEGGDYIHVEVEDDDDNNDDVDIRHNFQEVGSAIDDLWYFDEASVTLDLDSDPPFSESDMSSVRSGEELFVVCQESDVEFFADYSDTDSNSDDREYTQADNWTCLDCDLSNPPYQRFCNKCWKLRPDWLPWQQTSPDSKSNRIKVEKLMEDSIEMKGEAALRLFNSNFEGTDSGIGSFSSQQSSQESEQFSSTHKHNKDDLSLSATSVQEETSTCEIRHSFSNYQSKSLSPSSKLSTSLSPSSKLSTSLSSSSSVDSLCPRTTIVQGHDNKKGKSSPLDGPCIICLTNPKTASFIHGSSGHQVCCFSCAKRLKRRGKACPVCRRPIQKVVKNFIL